jgi:AraC-like DNA-binding protein
MSSFHYAGKTSGPRYEMWREGFSREWIAADFDSLGEDYVASKINVTQHAFLALCSMRSTPVRIDRRNDVVNTAAGSRYLIVASDSCMRARQRGRSVDLPCGQMTLMSADEPAQVAQLTEGSRWSIRISHKCLSELFRHVDDRIARPIDAGSELTTLLLRQMETAHRFGPKLDALANEAMARHLLDLVGLCLGADGDAAHVAAHRGLAAARLDAIKAAILRDIGRPDLALAQIAANHRLSTRYVQHLFELSGTSFTRFVLEQRLLLAHRLLREPRSRWRKISEVSAAAGFSDISYFNRAFRARFGARPTDVRSSFEHERGDPASPPAAADEPASG